MASLPNGGASKVDVGVGVQVDEAGPDKSRVSGQFVSSPCRQWPPGRTRKSDVGGAVEILGAADHATVAKNEIERHESVS
jgi:hypothetical protein